MGQRGEVFSTRLFADEGRKTFFFNVKENRFRDRYLNIVESRKTDRGFTRSSVVVFREDLEKFLGSLDGCLADLKARRQPAERTLLVGGGRREYTLRKALKGKPALQIVEKREDATGIRRESVIIPVAVLDAFREGIGKAVSAMS